MRLPRFAAGKRIAKQGDPKWCRKEHRNAKNFEQCAIPYFSYVARVKNARKQNGEHGKNHPKIIGPNDDATDHAKHDSCSQRSVVQSARKYDGVQNKNNGERRSQKFKWLAQKLHPIARERKRASGKKSKPRLDIFLFNRKKMRGQCFYAVKNNQGRQKE